MEENWKNIEGYEGLYQVSNFGRIRGLDRVVERKNNNPTTIKGRVKNNQQYVNGYLFVALCKNGIKKPLSVHRLVANSFIPNPDNKPEVNHKDLNKHNNHVDNLEWCSHSENHIHKNKSGIISPCFINNNGENNGRSKLTEGDVITIKKRMANGEIQKAIASEYYMSPSAINAIAKGKNWKNL